VAGRGGVNLGGGIDLVIEKNGERMAVRFKRRKTGNVGLKAAREFLGSPADARIQEGTFITPCGFTWVMNLDGVQHRLSSLSRRQVTLAFTSPTMLATLNRPWLEAEHLNENAGGPISTFRYDFARREAAQPVVWLHQVRNTRDKDDLFLRNIHREFLGEVRDPSLKDEALRNYSLFPFDASPPARRSIAGPTLSEGVRVAPSRHPPARAAWPRCSSSAPSVGPARQN